MTNMRVEKNVLIPMSDGTALRCNVFRPDDDGRYPIVMSFGVYGKDVHFEDSFTPQWQKLKSIYPEIDHRVLLDPSHTGYGALPAIYRVAWEKSSADRFKGSAP